MNQQAEAIRWYHQEKGLRPSDIARRMNLDLQVVHGALRRLGVTVAERQAKAHTGPKTFPEPVNRDACTFCGVRPEHHEQHGCRRRV